jgi:hypothetical protein
MHERKEVMTNVCLVGLIVFARTQKQREKKKMIKMGVSPNISMIKTQKMAEKY